MSAPATTKTDDAIKALKQTFMSEMAEAAVQLLPEVVEQVMTDDDLDQRRKFLDLAINTLGWKQAAPKDAFDNLPVFQFNFNGTGVTAQVSTNSAQPLEMVQEVREANATPFANSEDDFDLASLDAALAKADKRNERYWDTSTNQDVVE